MSEKYAIVAEYRNVAILERAGNVKSFWEGREYFTDGRTYIFFKAESADLVGRWSFDNERDAKKFIDCARDFPDDVPEGFRNSALNYKEMYQVLHQKPHKGEVPVYIFNEKIGAFTFFDGVRDGQHHHKGI